MLCVLVNAFFHLLSSLIYIFVLCFLLNRKKQWRQSSHCYPRFWGRPDLQWKTRWIHFLRGGGRIWSMICEDKQQCCWVIPKTNPIYRNIHTTQWILLALLIEKPYLFIFLVWTICLWNRTQFCSELQLFWGECKWLCWVGYSWWSCSWILAIKRKVPNLAISGQFFFPIISLFLVFHCWLLLEYWRLFVNLVKQINQLLLFVTECKSWQQQEFCLVDHVPWVSPSLLHLFLK